VLSFSQRYELDHWSTSPLPPGFHGRGQPSGPCDALHSVELGDFIVRAERQRADVDETGWVEPRLAVQAMTGALSWGSADASFNWYLDDRCGQRPELSEEMRAILAALAAEQ
jgi:hypothetical protein